MSSQEKVIPKDFPSEDPTQQQKQEDEWKQKLLELEKEIEQLKSVLNVKTSEASDLKKKLGMNPMNDIKDDVMQSIHMLQDSDVIQKTSAAFKSFGDYVTNTFSDVKNSNTVKNIEEKMGNAYNNVKSKLTPTSTSSSMDSDIAAPLNTKSNNFKCNNTTVTPGDHSLYPEVDQITKKDPYKDVQKP